MAITSKIFQTPTGSIYDPSQQIRRSGEQLTGIIGAGIQRQRERELAEEQAFGQIYNNLGEIESTLMDEYAGIQGEMIRSTRDFVKEQIKSGKSTTDPDFQHGMGQRVGRIKTAMANADRNRQLLSQAAEAIKNDPAIIDKGTATANLMQKFQDPDFLISKNQFNVGDYLNQYVNPQKVFETVAKNIPTTDQFTDQYTDAKGNLRQRTITFNDLIDRGQPMTEEGRLNINIPPEFVKRVMNGDYGQRIVQQTQKIAQRDYANMPTDIAFTNALRDGMGSVMSGNIRDTIVESASDIRRRKRQEARQQERLNLQRERQDEKETKEQPDTTRWGKFVEASRTGDNAILGDYEEPGGDIRGLKWVSEKDDPIRVNAMGGDTIAQAIQDMETWGNIERDRRVEIIEELGIEPPKAITGRWDTNKKEVLEKLQNKYLEENPPKEGRVLRWEEKVDGEWQEQPMRIETQDDLERAFRMLENLRKTGQGEKTETVVPESTNRETEGFIGVPKQKFN